MPAHASATLSHSDTGVARRFYFDGENALCTSENPTLYYVFAASCLPTLVLLFLHPMERGLHRPHTQVRRPKCGAPLQ